MKKVPFKRVQAMIKELCSMILGRNSVGEVLSLKTSDGVVRTAIEAVVYEKAESIGRDYLSKPEILKTIKNIKSCENVLEYMFSVFHNGIKENYVVCLCLRKPRLATYKPTDRLIINL